MDGDVADLNRLIAIKRQYPNILLYVDEAHAIGARGKTGLGIAEEQSCIQEIDLLVGTFGKALASMGGLFGLFRTIREYLVNTMRPLHIQYGPATVPNRMDFLHLGATPLVHERNGRIF